MNNAPSHELTTENDKKQYNLENKEKIKQYRLKSQQRINNIKKYLKEFHLKKQNSILESEINVA
jgi:hypothetical protein